MESLNQTIKKTLHFIAVIQDACDKRRLKLERHNLQGYDTFVKEWKTEKSTKPQKKSDIVLVETLQDEAAILEEDMEELALVDNLLEKARNIRLKNKSLLKKGETKQTLNGVQVSSNNTLKSSLVESQKQKPSFRRTDEPTFNKRPVPRSKSASISSKLKTSIVPRSKSANVQQILNGDENGQKFCRTSVKPISRNGRTITTSSQNEHTMYTTSNTAVLSGTELNKFKNIGSSQNFRKKKSPFIHSGEKELLTSNSDLKQCPEKQTQFPTYRKFLKESQRISVSNSSFRMQICGIWYPFLSLKSKKYLLEQPNLVSLNNFPKALKLIHQIQETMLWIDLLSLIGRDAIPNLHLLDEADWNVIRLCSFLESIYNENLQRTPILDPN